MTNRRPAVCFCVFASLSLVAACADVPEQKPVAHTFLAHAPIQGKVYKVAPNGDVVGEYTVGTKGEDSWLLPDGHILASFSGGVREIDPATGATTWEYKAGPGVEVHSCQPLPGQRVLICECGSKRLFEINRDLTIAHEIKLESTQPTHKQFRLARKTAAGTYLVAYGSDAVVRELDADGKILQKTAKFSRPLSSRPLKTPASTAASACRTATRSLLAATARRFMNSTTMPKLSGR